MIVSPVTAILFVTICFVCFTIMSLPSIFFNIVSPAPTILLYDDL